MKEGHCVSQLDWQLRLPITSSSRLLRWKQKCESSAMQADTWTYAGHGTNSESSLRKNFHNEQRACESFFHWPWTQLVGISQSGLIPLHPWPTFGLSIFLALSSCRFLPLWCWAYGLATNLLKSDLARYRSNRAVMTVSYALDRWGNGKWFSNIPVTPVTSPFLLFRRSKKFGPGFPQCFIDQLLCCSSWKFFTDRCWQ